MLCWVGNNQPMKMRETPRATDKKPWVNNKQVIDSDYRGEIMVALHNHSDKAGLVMPNQRIAQIVILPVVLPVFEEVDKLEETERADGGFGSTGN